MKRCTAFLFFSLGFSLAGATGALALLGCNSDHLVSALQKVLDTSVQESRLDRALALTLGLALPNGTTIALAAGYASYRSRRYATPSDIFLLGSSTKMYTSAAVLRLVEQGKFGLDDEALPLLDKLFQKLNGTSLEAYYGQGIRSVTVRQLLQMSAGIPDFDVNSRGYQLKHLKEDLGPVQNIGFSKPTLSYTPGAHVEYSSTNYELLGLILAQSAGATSWDTYDQKTGLPTEVLKEMPHTKFGVRGTCEAYNAVHGLCTEGTLVDTYYMSCTNGWTCGNLLSNGGDAAYFARALLGPGERVIKAATQREAQEWRPLEGFASGTGYGLGLMDLSEAAGFAKNSKKYVGHAGATYGFMSNVGYLHDLDLGLAVSANNEFGTSETVLRKVVAAIQNCYSTEQPASRAVFV